jgi:hypothetical protein
MTSPLDDSPLQIPIDLRALQRRAHQYARRCEAWLTERADARADVVHHSVVVVGRLSLIVPTEINHAVAGWLRPDDAPRELVVDPEDAAAMALVAIEHSRSAWMALLRCQEIRAIAAEPFITDLVWLKHEMLRVFPNVRTVTECSTRTTSSSRDTVVP